MQNRALFVTFLWACRVWALVEIRHFPRRGFKAIGPAASIITWNHPAFMFTPTLRRILRSQNVILSLRTYKGHISATVNRQKLHLAPFGASLPPSSLRFYSSPPASSIPIPPAIASLPNPDSDGLSEKKKKENAEILERVHQWLERFKQMDPSAMNHAKGVEMSFSRSSGPGGQNVNKVNTKVTARCSINVPWIPTWSKHLLLKDPHYAASSESILVTSSTTRSQAQNIDDCLAKIHGIILSASTADLRNPTSEETKKRVQEHIKADKARKRAEKEYRSSVKQARSGGSKGGYDF